MVQAQLQLLVQAQAHRRSYGSSRLFRDHPKGGKRGADPLLLFAVVAERARFLSPSQTTNSFHGWFHVFSILSSIFHSFILSDFRSPFCYLFITRWIFAGL